MNGKALLIGIVANLIVGTFFFFLPIVAKSPYRWRIVVGLVTPNILIIVTFFLISPSVAKSPYGWLIVVGLVAFTTFITLCFIRWIFRPRKIGIKNVVLSMTRGKGSTKSILQTVVHQFSFMGIAAKKWIEQDALLERAMKKISGFKRDDSIRFLLLDPDSNVAKNISETQHHNINTIPKLIRKTIDHLKEMREKGGYKIELKLYSFKPIFRIAIVNNNIAYVGFYRGDAKEGKDSPQLILDLDKQQEISYFLPFQEYFNEIWKNRSKKYNWEND